MTEQLLDFTNESRQMYHPRDANKWQDMAIAQTSNPRHLAILRNWRRHGLLEVTGNWEQILSPELTVEHPVYRVNVGGNSVVYDGREAVGTFYQALYDSGMSALIGPIRQYIMVSDWGFATHGVWGQQLNAAAAAAALQIEVDDPDDHYYMTSAVAEVWHYTDDCRLLGEHLFEDTSSRNWWKMNPADVVTPEEALEIISAKLETELAGAPVA